MSIQRTLLEFALPMVLLFKGSLFAHNTMNAKHQSVGIYALKSNDASKSLYVSSSTLPMIFPFTSPWKPHLFNPNAFHRKVSYCKILIAAQFVWNLIGVFTSQCVFMDRFKFGGLADFWMSWHKKIPLKYFLQYYLFAVSTLRGSYHYAMSFFIIIIYFLS